MIVKIFMANKFVVGAECAIEHDGKFLIIKRPPGKHAEGMLAFPGGGVEIEDGIDFDVLANAARREVFEEVGLTIVDPLKYIASDYFIDSKTNAPSIFVLFHCKIINTNLELNISTREVAEYYWLSKSEITARDNCPEWLAKYLTFLL